MQRAWESRAILIGAGVGPGAPPPWPQPVPTHPLHRVQVGPEGPRVGGHAVKISGHSRASWSLMFQWTHLNVTCSLQNVMKCGLLNSIPGSGARKHKQTHKHKSASLEICVMGMSRGPLALISTCSSLCASALLGASDICCPKV